MGRWLDEFVQFRLSKLLFLPHDVRCDALAIDREWDEDRFAGIARNPFAAKSNVFDCKFDGSHRRTFA